MPEMSFGRAMTWLAEQNPDAPAITCAGTTMTRRMVEVESNQRARALAKLGVNVDDLVVVALPNTAEILTNALGIWKLGATPVLVSGRLPAGELNAILELADPKVVIGGPAPQTDRSWPWLAADWQPEAGTDSSALPDVIARSWKAPCSGGSTGRPKLILEGHPGVIDPESPQGFGLDPGLVQLITAPLYHNAPFGYGTRGLLTGQHLVIMPRFDPIEMLSLVDQHKVNWVMVVPTMMNRVWRLPEADRLKYDVSSLQKVWHMAAPCPSWLKQAWIEWLGPEKIWELYGSSEQIAATAISGQEWLDHPGSVGRPIFGEVTVRSEDGADLPAGEVGELYMRSPGGVQTFRYVGAEPRESPDGWTSVGDLGSIDSDGYLYIADRRLDLILSGGSNVFPAEVEAAIGSHPLVAEAVVIGIADDDLGQRIHALVRVEGELSVEELLDYLATQIVRYKIPRTIEFVSEPIRDEAGKVRRSALRTERESA